MKTVSRKQILERLHSRLENGYPLLIAQTGMGIIAKEAVKMGVDMLLTSSADLFRMDRIPAGAEHLPCGDCNAITMELADYILPHSESVPVIAGIGAADPYHSSNANIKQVTKRGFSGAANLPSVSTLACEAAQEYWEQSGAGFSREVDLIRCCRNQDVFSLACVSTPLQAMLMARAGADLIMACPNHATIDAFRAIHLAAAEKKHDILVVGCAETLDIPLDVILKETGLCGWVLRQELAGVFIEKSIYDTVTDLESTRIR